MAKENEVRGEIEELQQMMEVFDNERHKFETGKIKAEQTAIKVTEDSEFVKQHQDDYDDNRAELERLRYEIETEKAHLRTDYI
jgi:hypothetical protein